MELSKKMIGGLLLAVITLSSGTTYYLQDTGTYKNCSGGWVLREDGMYECPTREIEPQWCHHGSSDGPENIGYRCYLGIVIDTDEPVVDKVKVRANNKDWDCEVKNGRIDSYTRCKSGTYDAYIGELI